MAKCTECGQKAGFLMSVCDNCIRAEEIKRRGMQIGSQEQESGLAKNVRHNSSVPSDIGYIQGWFCGFIPIVAVITVIMNLTAKRFRRSFQAIGIAVGTLIWYWGTDIIISDPLYGRIIEIGILLKGIGLGIPLITLTFLRSLTWPKPRKYSHTEN